MEITFLKACNGDCIHIEHNSKHIFIDGGTNKQEFTKELVSLLEAIRDKNECIDLLIITHYDEDHIWGIYNVLQDFKCKDGLNNFVKEVWFNATKLGFHGTKFLNTGHGNKFSSFLEENKISWVSEIQKGHCFPIDSQNSLEVLYGGYIYDSEHKGNQLCAEKCDWDSSFEELNPYSDDKALDTSAINSQSMIIILKSDDKKYLFTGDATPGRLIEALNQYHPEGKIKLELFKMAHHGSYQNITNEILNKIECNHFVISTNGERYYHPNKKALLKIFNWRNNNKKNQKIFIHLNYYDKLFPLLKINKCDLLTYNFECDGKRNF